MYLLSQARVIYSKSHVEKKSLIEKHIRLTRDVRHPEWCYDMNEVEVVGEEEVVDEMRETQTVLQ